MFRKNVYVTLIILSSISQILLAEKVEVNLEFHVDDRIGQGIFTIDSKEYFHLSMDKESLGVAIRLASSTKGREAFEIIPTNNNIPLGNIKVYGQEEITLGKGASFNGHVLEKELVVKFSNLKHIEEKP